MSRTIYILNGPNLNLLGTREPHIYGTTTLKEIEGMCHTTASTHGLTVMFRQSNHQGEIVDWIHEARTQAAAIIINPAAYTFTSVAILDALKMFAGPIIELHISNLHKREAVYHNSPLSPVVTAVMAGLGADGYAIAIKGIAALLAKA
jgi:3-dehydroquinate dehydratase-2